MAHLTRRSVLRGSLALAAAGTGTLSAPHIAKAAATTATVWFAQGFVQDEDVALRKAVADYEKQSGNKIELSIIPFAPERQKIISALTSGVVPDLFDSNPAEIVQLYGWQDRWVDVSDVVETQRSQFSETALLAAQAYNNVTKKRATYGVPLRAAVVPCHIWKSLVEKAGMKIEDLPKTWDAYFDFFKKVQDNLRKQGERKVYGLGFQVTANGVDPYNLFMAFLVGYTNGLIPKGAKNVTVAKEFLKYFIQSKVIGEFVELGLGRWLPVMPSLAKSPFWQNPKDPHFKGYVQQGLLGPTRPDYYVFNLAMAEVRSQHVWSMAMIDVAKEGVKAEAAIEKAFKRIGEIFAKYPMA